MQHTVAATVLELDAPPLVWWRGSKQTAPQLGSPRSAVLYGAFVVGLAVLTVQSAASQRPSLTTVPLAGCASLAVLLAVTAHARARRPVWSMAGPQPLVLFGAALAMLLIPWTGELLAYDQVEVIGTPGWPSVLAGLLLASGILLMVREMAPGRAVDALYLSCIGAAGIGLLLWVGAPLVTHGRAVATGRQLELLVPVLVDLVVVGLALQAVRFPTSARTGFWLLVVAWTSVLIAHLTEVLAAFSGSGPSARTVAAFWIVGVGFLGAAALHPSTAAVGEPVVGSLDRLPRSQIVFLALAVVLMPIAVACGLRAARPLPLVVVLTSLLGALVVGYLVRLVQGHATFEHRALHDGLTGLPNRTLFEERAAAGIARARRNGASSAMLFLDLDRFKSVNDRLGHTAGNLLLQAVGHRLRTSSGPDETVARVGGDEFVIFLPELEEPEDAAARAHSILRQFGDPFALNGHTIFVSPSIGVAVSPRDGHDADSLIEAADSAMYRAKQCGRGTFCTYEPAMRNKVHVSDSDLDARLREAMEHDELRIHYQPKYRVDTGRLVGMEALLRWQHPSLGLLSPSAFVPLAEETGLIVPMGEWALEEACRQTQSWVDAGFDPLVVAVNLSLRQFQQQHIGSVVARVLRSTGLCPDLLELEVTESLAMQDPASVRSSLADLREMGVACSIDDFGTGYSGLSLLTEMPIDKLKIDKSFIATLDSNRQAPIVVAVVALARGLGLEVVAEGVESEAQLERLRELGCDEVQGYLFSEPIAAADFEQLMLRQGTRPRAQQLEHDRRPMEPAGAR